MVTIDWNKNILPEHKAEIEHYLSPYLWLIPKWCHKLSISVYASDDSSNISTGINYDYRQAWMNFYSSWLIESETKKQLDVIHDLLHISTSVYVDFAEHIIKTLCPANEAEKFHTVLLEQSRVNCESMVQDLAYSIMNQPKYISICEAIG